jgi:hypothetical protein
MTVSTAMRRPLLSFPNNHNDHFLFRSTSYEKVAKDTKMVKPQHYAPEIMVLPHGELDDESSTMSALGHLEEKTQGQPCTEEFVTAIFRERSVSDEILDDMWLLKRANPVFDSEDDEDDETCD